MTSWYNKAGMTSQYHKAGTARLVPQGCYDKVGMTRLVRQGLLQQAAVTKPVAASVHSACHVNTILIPDREKKTSQVQRR